MTCVDDAAVGCCHSPCVEQAEQEVVNVRVSPVDLVHEQDAAGTLERGEERGDLRMPAVARRRADEACDLDRVGQLTAIDPEDVGVGGAEHLER